MGQIERPIVNISPPYWLASLIVTALLLPFPSLLADALPASPRPTAPSERRVAVQLRPNGDRATLLRALAALGFRLTREQLVMFERPKGGHICRPVLDGNLPIKNLSALRGTPGVGMVYVSNDPSDRRVAE